MNTANGFAEDSKYQHLCRVCGAVPVKKRSRSGWEYECPNGHFKLFEQWINKCRRKWGELMNPEGEAKIAHKLPKLTAAQIRVMQLMSRRWSAQQPYGGAVHINGKRVCNVDTMTVLERHGLIERDTRWTWRATQAGLEWRPAQ